MAETDNGAVHRITRLSKLREVVDRFVARPVGQPSREDGHTMADARNSGVSVPMAVATPLKNASAGHPGQM